MQFSGRPALSAGALPDDRRLCRHSPPSSQKGSALPIVWSAWPIKKGNLGHPVQFGYTVQIIEVEDALITDYPDVEVLELALDRHGALVGRVPLWPRPIAAIRSAANEKDGKDRGIRTVAIPKRGKKSDARLAYERRRAFHQAQRWRVGGEGTIRHH